MEILRKVRRFTSLEIYRNKIILMQLLNTLTEVVVALRSPSELKVKIGIVFFFIQVKRLDDRVVNQFRIFSFIIFWYLFTHSSAKTNFFSIKRVITKKLNEVFLSRKIILIECFAVLAPAEPHCTEKQDCQNYCYVPLEFIKH